MSREKNSLKFHTKNRGEKKELVWKNHGRSCSVTSQRGNGRADPNALELEKQIIKAYSDQHY